MRDRGQAALAAVGRALHGRGWCPGTGGNLSLVLETRPPRLLVTRSGADKGDLGTDDFVLVDERGCAVDGETGQPSAEAKIHASVVRCSDAGAVLHTHSVAATLVGEHFREKGGLRITGYEMLKGLAGTPSHESTILLPILPNGQDMDEMSRAVESLFRGTPPPHGFLLAGHGLYAWGDDLPRAQRHLETLEFLLELTARRTRFEAFHG